jgi:antitoxin component YwqK of YwqJK toxin-antitoxin module
MFFSRKPKPTSIDQIDKSKDGKHKVYYTDGKKLKLSFHTQDGQFHGLYEILDKDGNLILTRNFVRGKLQGNSIEYYSSEYSKRFIILPNSALSDLYYPPEMGITISKHRPLQIKSHAQFENGLQTGSTKSFHFLTGNKFREFVIENGLRSQLIEHDADGTIKFKNDGSHYQFFHFGSLTFEANIHIPPLDDNSLKELKKYAEAHPYRYRSGDGRTTGQEDLIKRIGEIDWTPQGTWVGYEDDKPVMKLHFDREELKESELHFEDINSGITRLEKFEKGKLGLLKIMNEFAPHRLEIQNISPFERVETRREMQLEWFINLTDFIQAAWELPDPTSVQICPIDEADLNYANICSQINTELSQPNSTKIVKLNRVQHHFENAEEWVYDEFSIFANETGEFIFFREHEDTYSGEIGRNLKVDYSWNGEFQDFHTMGCLLMILYWKDKCNYHQLENDDNAFNFHKCLEEVYKSSPDPFKPNLEHKKLIQIGTKWLMDGDFLADRFFTDLHLLNQEDWESICKTLKPSENWNLGDFLMFGKAAQVQGQFNKSWIGPTTVEEVIKQKGQYAFSLEEDGEVAATVFVQWLHPLGTIQFKTNEDEELTINNNHISGELTKKQISMIRSKIEAIIKAKQ